MSTELTPGGSMKDSIVWLIYVVCILLALTITAVVASNKQDNLWKEELIKHQLGKYVIDARTGEHGFVLIREDKTEVKVGF